MLRAILYRRGAEQMRADADKAVRRFRCGEPRDADTGSHAQGLRASFADLARQSRGPRSHLVSEVGSRQEKPRRWISRPSLAANGQRRSGFGRVPRWERKLERVLLRSALTCFLTWLRLVRT
jgi:hypothetical protein